jgi:hypothetical protein
LQQYAVHRLAHRSAFLWSMHSLHHSARVVTVTSSTRHFWFEEVLGVALGLPIGLALRVPVEILIVAAPLRSLIVALAHTNVRAGHGFISLLITGPQYHRIHHSSRPEHIDKNFAELFPLWDMIFGTVWRPKPDEFPATGLVSGDVPVGFVDLIVWPVRHRVARAIKRQSRDPAARRMIMETGWVRSQEILTGRLQSETRVNRSCEMDFFWRATCAPERARHWEPA